MASGKRKITLEDLGVILGNQSSPQEVSSSNIAVNRLEPLLSPLQVLIAEKFPRDNKNNELADQVLAKTVEAESTSCKQLYQQLCDRTESLADEVITVHFPWRLRVGGTRGFRDLILPVFHPVYGIPYVPSSSLKGFVRAWAHQSQQQELNQLLGFLEGSQAAMATVQILDAFPTRPCLMLDMANPQWAWQDNQVIYGTVPHALLSMADVTLKIGLVRTSLGTIADVQRAKAWLEKAFQSEGLGARVSAGYGQADRVNGTPLRRLASVTHPYSSEYPFEFWSEGIHGIDPKNKREFRPVAVRGVLRYWFRAVGLALYQPDDCHHLEQYLFGGIEPKPQEGNFKLITVIDQENLGTQNSIPHSGLGRIILQTKDSESLQLMEMLLKLAFHLGGIGRGARRPLHSNSGRLRGCFWQSTEAETQLSYNLQPWQDFFKALLDVFNQIQPVKRLADQSSLTVARTKHPTVQRPRLKNEKYGQEINEKRSQDILNGNARIFLVPSPKLKHPRQVQNWNNEGQRYNVRGAGLEFFYSSGFKGVNRNEEGNSHVGGELGVPSRSEERRVGKECRSRWSPYH